MIRPTHGERRGYRLALPAGCSSPNREDGTGTPGKTVTASPHPGGYLK
jgi:hypothetical protein